MERITQEAPERTELFWMLNGWKNIVCIQSWLLNLPVKINSWYGQGIFSLPPSPDWPWNTLLSFSMCIGAPRVKEAKALALRLRMSTDLLPLSHTS